MDPNSQMRFTPYIQPSQPGIFHHILCPLLIFGLQPETHIFVFFSRVHATLQSALSVGPSVGRSVTLSFFSAFYIILGHLSYFKLFKVILNQFTFSLLVFWSFNLLVLWS